MRSVFLCLLLAGCSAAPAAIPTAHFREPERRQILAPHLEAPWRSAHCGMACGLPHRDGFRVWYTGNIPGGFHICRADFDAYWRFVSESHGPVLKPGKTGEFDAAAVFMPCVIDPGDGQPLRMYYAAHAKGSFPSHESSTGLAISKDGGETWEKAGQILTATGSDSDGVGTHCVYRDGDRWVMIYTHIEGRVRPGGMRYFLCFATSSDGLTWERPAGNLALDHDGGTSARPSVWRQSSGIYLMLYTHHARAGRGPNSYRIRIATSKDGLHFEDRGQWLDVAGHGWESQMVCYPWAIPSKGVAIYTGNEFGRGGLGVAKLHLAP